MTYLLVVWTIVASAGTSTSVYTERDWRSIGEFKTAEACQNASRAMGVGTRALCIPTNSKGSK